MKAALIARMSQVDLAGVEYADASHGTLEEVSDRVQWLPTRRVVGGHGARREAGHEVLPQVEFLEGRDGTLAIILDEAGTLLHLGCGTACMLEEAHLKAEQIALIIIQTHDECDGVMVVGGSRIPRHHQQLLDSLFASRVDALYLLAIGEAIHVDVGLESSTNRNQVGT